MQLRRPKHPGRVAIVAIGLLVAANLALLGVLWQETGTEADNRPAAIEDLFPIEGSVVRPQEAFGANLSDNLQGVLYMDGVRLPEDQYSGDEELGQVIYQPGEDKDIEELDAGEHVAIVEWWERDTTEDDARAAREVFSYTWRFTVGF
jgi:hypothetical protein